MRASTPSSRHGFVKVLPAVLALKSSASSSRGEGEGGSIWRKKSDHPELLNSSSPSRVPSSGGASSPRKPGKEDKLRHKSFAERRIASSSKKQDQGASRTNGSFTRRTFSTERAASDGDRSPSSEIDDGKDISASSNGLQERRKKQPKIREQIRIVSPISQDPHIAILGGGMSGLICALTLQEKGIRATVFDTGKHGLGGRMGTRHVAQLDGDQLIFDHAAQYFTATDPKFQKLVNQWLMEGAVKEWNGVVGRLEKGGNFTELLPCTKYIAPNGMRLFADHLLSKRQLIDVRRPVWISKLHESGGVWHLNEYDKDHGEFDCVVIAHNGKCANRLLGPIGVPLVAKQMKRLELSSIWALMAAFNEPLPAPALSSGSVQVEGAFVMGIDALSWMGNNTAKLQPAQHSGPYCWTFFSTAKYGKKNKVPQESIPNKRAERVKREMLQGVEKALGLEEGSLPAPLYMKVQLWGAGNPINTPNIPCIFDAYGRVGICGDWLLGSNLEAAALSGMAMANQISAFCERKGSSPEEFSMGLEKELLPAGGHDIGQFAEQPSAVEALPSEVLTAA